VRSYEAGRESILGWSEGLGGEILRIVGTLGQGQHDDLSTIVNQKVYINQSHNIGYRTNTFCRPSLPIEP